MKNFLGKVKRTFFNRSFLLYCVAGAINTFNAALFSSLSHFVFQENVAAVMGYLISLTISFLLNCHFVFKRRMNLRSYLRFLLSYIPNFIIYFLITFVTISALDLPQFWGTVLAAMAGGPVTFLIIKFYAFSKNEKLNQE